MKKTPILLIIALVGLLQACGGAKIPTNPCGVGEKRGKFRAAINPAQMQVVLVKVAASGKNRATLTCLNRNLDTVMLRYGWNIGQKPYHLLKPGLKLTVRYDSLPCEPGTWVMADIKINK